MTVTIPLRASFTLGLLDKIVPDDFDNESFGNVGWGLALNPPVRFREACGYNPECYISTAGLAVVPYTDSASIIGRVGGNLQVLIPATDDSVTGDVDAGIFNSILSNVTKEINGFISSIYPIPLARIGTVAIFQVTSVSSDGLGTVTGIKMLANGGYQSAPATPNSPAYLRFKDWRDYENCWGWNWDWSCNNGTGLSLTVAFTTPSAVTVQTPIVVNGVPVIANGGTGYQVNDLQVLVGGTSFVPDKIANAANSLFCYELLRRRLVPDEKNMFEGEAAKVKKELEQIGNGEKVMDGTYRTFFSPVSAFVQQSVLQGNSL